MSDDENNDEPPARRDFLNLALVGTAAALGVAAAYPVARFLEPTSRRALDLAEVGKVDDFPVGSSKTVLLADRPVLVIRRADGSFRAFSALCTHLQCVVGFSQERQLIECRCHKGVYSLEGENIAGPPPRPLQPLEVAVVDGVVVVGTA